jgi:uncharacterized glyoxalase superfamily metalloenzyme YdcJ
VPAARLELASPPAGQRIRERPQLYLARRYLRQEVERIRATCADAGLSDEQVEDPATEALVKAAEQAEPDCSSWARAG